MADCSSFGPRAMQEQVYEPVYIAASCDDAGQETLEWKAWRYSDGTVHREVRRPVLFVLPEQAGFQLTQICKRDLAAWMTLCIGMLGRDSVNYSLKSASSQQNAELVMDPKTRQEMVCSTCALLLLLLHMWRYRRSRSQKSAAGDLLVGLLTKLPLALEVEPWLQLRVPPEQWAACIVSPGQDGMCECLQAALSAWALCMGTGHRGYADRLWALMPFFGCPVVLLAFRGALAECASAMDIHVKAGAWNNDPLKSTYQVKGKRKQRRVDEDFKAACFQAVQDGRGHTVESFGKALADDRCAGAWAWDGRFLQQFMVAGWMTFGKGGIFSIALDATSFSNPGEETVAYAIWHANSGYGHWLLVQAIRGVRPTTTPQCK